MTKTINGLTVTTSAASGDLLAIWRAANSDTRKITKANFMGGVLTGAGTVATGGFTLTVPATGTASLLGTAQTYTALKTFDSGLYSKNYTIADDTYQAMTGGGSGGMLIFGATTTSETTVGGVVFYRGTTTPHVTSLSVASNTNVGALGALTGTSGTDGKFTVSVTTSGTVYFENRRGASVSIVLLWVTI